MGNSIRSLSARVTLVASADTWIESKAIQQLEKTAELEGIVSAAGMPDLHPGRGYPIGAVFLTRQRLYPALVGNDIGCGMALWKTDLLTRKINLDKFERRLLDIDEPLDASWADLIAERQQHLRLTPTGFDRSLGTIGGGNHFAELQQLDQVLDQELLATTNIDKKSLVLLVHSGSRGFGEWILRQHVEKFSHQGLIENTEDFTAYLDQHEQALRFAMLNRELIARRMLNRLGASGERVLEVNHNLVSPVNYQNESCWLHRKGATPADVGLVMIPGSRGDYSYLVQPKFSEASLYSLAHGAGRKWMRSECKDRLSHRYRATDLHRTALGSRVICKNKDLLFEEAPEAYKSIEKVLESMIQADLITPVARFKPVLTYKTQGGGC